MKPVMQTLFYDKDGTGNCFEACLASMFEMDLKDVPNFHGENWFGMFLEWLKVKGYTSYGSLYDESVEEYIGGVKGYFIVAGESQRGKHIKGGHAVVYKDGKLVHDPHPDGTGVVSVKYIMSIEKEKTEDARSDTMESGVQLTTFAKRLQRSKQRSNRLANVVQNCLPNHL